MKADLHVHSSYSDGNMSIEEIARYAKEKELSLVAITDHDNLASRNDISRLDGDVLLLCGVELSTYHNGENVHILGYFYNNEVKNKAIVAYLDELRVNREKRVHVILDKLRRFCNIDINYEDVLKLAGGAIGRVHIAKAVSSKYGYTIDQVFDNYIGNGKIAYVPTTMFKTSDAIKLLHDNNAIAVIAHPGHIKKNDVLDVVQLGVDGIEVYYPEHSSDDINRYLQIAKDYNLLVTGGSDFHGIGVREDLATSTISDEDIGKLLNKLKIKKRN